MKWGSLKNSFNIRDMYSDPRIPFALRQYWQARQVAREDRLKILNKLEAEVDAFLAVAAPGTVKTEMDSEIDSEAHEASMLPVW